MVLGYDLICWLASPFVGLSRLLARGLGVGMFVKNKVGGDANKPAL